VQMHEWWSWSTYCSQLHALTYNLSQLNNIQHFL
jgi:hypothetical protein